jgi:hypothetical protein
MVMSAFGSANQGMSEWNLGKKTWHETKRQMALKEIQSAEEVRLMQNRLDELVGAQTAKYGSAGVKLEGSPMDIINATQREGLSEIEYKKMLDLAQIAEMRRAGRLAKKAGGVAASGALMSGIGNFAGSMEKIFSMGLAGETGQQGWAMKNPATGRVSRSNAGGGFNWWSLLGS